MNPRTFRRLALAPALVVLAAAVPSPPAQAQAQDVYDRLQSDTMSIFDYGIKRLRSIAIQVLPKLRGQGDPRPQSEVSFDPEARQIRINFFVPMNAGNVSQATCWERRALAIRELFFIGATPYTVPVSNEQRIVRRLGAMFTKEPIDFGNVVQATGERLSELTRVRMTIPLSGGTAPLVCESRVADLRAR